MLLRNSAIRGPQTKLNPAGSQLNRAIGGAGGRLGLAGRRNRSEVPGEHGLDACPTARTHLRDGIF